MIQSTISETFEGPVTVGVREPAPGWNLIEYWILLLPLLFFAVDSTFSLFSTAVNTPMAGAFGMVADTGPSSRVHSVLSLVCYTIVLATILFSGRSVLRTCLQNRIVFALPALAVMSIVWSQFPGRTALYALFIALNTVFALYLVARFRPDQQMSLILLTGAVAIILSILLVVAYPKAGIDMKEAGGHPWEGLYPHKNVAAMLTLLLLFPVFSIRVKTIGMRLLRVAYVIFSLFLIVMTTSRTGWLLTAGLLPIAALLPKIRRIQARDLLLILLGVLTLSAIVVPLVYSYSADILKLLGKDPTLTGRTIIWKAVITSAMKRPFLGYGYYAFWNGFKGESINTALAAGDLALGNAENGILQLWLELGLVGVVILGLYLFRTCRNAAIAFRSDAPRYVDWYVMILLFTLLSLVDGGKFFFPHALYWMLFVMADAGLAAEARRVKTARLAV